MQSIDYKAVRILEAGGVGILTPLIPRNLLILLKNGRNYKKHRIRPSEVHGGVHGVREVRRVVHSSAPTKRVAVPYTRTNHWLNWPDGDSRYPRPSLWTGVAVC